MSESKLFAQAKIGVAWLSALVFAHAAQAAATAKPAAATPAPAAASAQPQPKELPSLTEILTEAEARDSVVQEIERRLQDRQRIDALALEIGEMQKAFTTARRTTAEPWLDRLNVYELADLRLTIRRGSDRLKVVIDELSAKARALDSDLDRLAANERAWKERLDVARARNAPQALKERIEAIAPSDAALAKSMRAHRDRILDVLGRATGLHGEMIAVLAELDSQSALLLKQMKTAREVPIWRAQLQAEEFSRMRAFAATETGRAWHYLSEYAPSLLTIGILAFGLSYSLIFATRGRIAREAETDYRARRTADLFHYPGVAALVVTLLALVWYAPAAPLIYYNLAWSLIPIPAALLAHNLLGSKINLSLYALALAVMSVSLLSTLELLPILNRLALIAQCLVLGAALAIDLQRGGMARAFTVFAPATTRKLVGAAIVLLALAIAANVLGYLGIARTLRNGVLGALGLGLVLAVLGHLIYGLLLALMQTAMAQRLRIVRLQSHALQRGVFKLLRASALLTWFVGTAMAFGFGIKLIELTRSMTRASVKLGSVTLSMESIFVGLLVLAGTFVLVKIIRWVMEVEVLPRLALKSGVPFAISTLSGYLLIVAGVVLAMAAMGIDLTKVSLLAGALGVGIGFGLQSVVNNFVSGLILLVERPISVGDTIQTQNLWGEVQRIGVRSSTVRTFQGAEVIVPNADLISKEVTNWTLSDRRRRLDIDVGVAYGSDPEQVVRLLEAAAQEVQEVLADPPPRAWFTGFGDSALNFCLHTWIDNFDRGQAMQSTVRMAILKHLNLAGIEIPFPQRDINIRSAPGLPPGLAGAPPVEAAKNDS